MGPAWDAVAQLLNFGAYGFYTSLFVRESLLEPRFLPAIIRITSVLKLYDFSNALRFLKVKAVPSIFCNYEVPKYIVAVFVSKNVDI